MRKRAVPRPLSDLYWCGHRTLGVEARRVWHLHRDHFAVLERDQAIIEVAGRHREGLAALLRRVVRWSRRVRLVPLNRPSVMRIG